MLLELPRRLAVIFSYYSVPMIGEQCTCDVCFAELANGLVDPDVDALILTNVHIE